MVKIEKMVIVKISETRFLFSKIRNRNVCNQFWGVYRDNVLQVMRR